MEKEIIPVRIRNRKDAVMRLATGVGGVPFLCVPAFDACCATRHAFSTRLGGVSRGIFSSMNLSFTRGDEDADVAENYRRMAAVLGAGAEDICCTFQTHTVNIRRVYAADRGKGVTREREYTDIDGLITDEEGPVLACYMADCVPLLFADPLHHAIGAAHAGWRGTVAGMAAEMVRAMREAFGSRPEGLFAVIGPSICGDCYEVSGDVADRVREAIWRAPRQSGARRHGETGARSLLHALDPYDASDTADILREQDAEGKFLLDLHALNRRMLTDAGVLPEHIFTTDICTRCNPELLFSHRAHGNDRGSLAAFIRLA